MADDQCRRLEGDPVQVVGSDPAVEDPAQHGGTRRWILADPIETNLSQEGNSGSRDHAGAGGQPGQRRAPELQGHEQRGEGKGGGWDRVTEDRHLHDQALEPVGCRRSDLEGDVGPQRGATHDHPLELEVIEQSDGLAGEGRHRVVPHLKRAV
jgi:hypothetical protein